MHLGEIVVDNQAVTENISLRRGARDDKERVN
jgi:hypothetical protein